MQSDPRKNLARNVRHIRGAPKGSGKEEWCDPRTDPRATHQLKFAYSLADGVCRNFRLELVLRNMFTMGI